MPPDNHTEAGAKMAGTQSEDSQRIEQLISPIVSDFTSRKNRLWILISIGLILVMVAWKTKLGALRPTKLVKQAPDTIGYHYEQWLHQRQMLNSRNAKGFNFRTIAWYLDGKPTFRQTAESVEEHELALIRLGYFDERKFEWPQDSISIFMSNFTKQAQQTPLKENWSVHYVKFVETNLTFTARTEDMPIVESIYQTLIASKTNKAKPPLE